MKFFSIRVSCNIIIYIIPKREESWKWKSRKTMSWVDVIFGGMMLPQIRAMIGARLLRPSWIWKKSNYIIVKFSFCINNILSELPLIWLGKLFITLTTSNGQYEAGPLNRNWVKLIFITFPAVVWILYPQSIPWTLLPPSLLGKVTVPFSVRRVPPHT